METHFLSIKTVVLDTDLIVVLKVSRTISFTVFLEKLKKKFEYVVTIDKENNDNEKTADGKKGAKGKEITGLAYKDRDYHLITLADEEDWDVCVDECSDGRLTLYAGLGGREVI
ncbi:hypothetical protein HK104_001614 [Borealophlyctis nickersoniae]|nr:hypothetical protein HK104_001614 [Borealophlyctis nickersoniae]